MENSASETCVTLYAQHVLYIRYVLFVPIYFRANSKCIAQHTHSHTECLGLSWFPFWDGGRMPLSIDISVREREVNVSLNVNVSVSVSVSVRVRVCG